MEWAAQECGPRPVLANRQKHRHEAFPNTSTDIEHFHNSLTKQIGAWDSYVSFPHIIVFYEKISLADGNERQNPRDLALALKN